MAHRSADGNGVRDRIVHSTVPTASFIGAAAAFFLGSAVLFQSGTPGASTPIPWLLSHFLWIGSSALLAVGTVAVLDRRPAFRRGISGKLAAGAFGLAAFQALQWTSWVYVDVFAYRQGEHDALFDPLLHPFGTAHAFGVGLLIGFGVVVLAWGLLDTPAIGRLVGWTGIAVGCFTAGAASIAVLTFADATDPAGLLTVLSLAVSHAWVLLLGTTVDAVGGESVQRSAR